MQTLHCHNAYIAAVMMCLCWLPHYCNSAVELLALSASVCESAAPGVDLGFALQVMQKSAQHQIVNVLYIPACVSAVHPLLRSATV